MKRSFAAGCIVGSVLFTAVISQAFTVGTKQKILEDALTLSPASLKAYLEPKHEQLATAIYDQNKIFHRYKLNRQMWKKNMIGQFDTLKARLRDKKGEYNTFIHFANLLEASCNYIDYGYESLAIRASTFFCPSKVTYDGYQRVEDIEAFVLEIDTIIDSRSECFHDDPRYNERYILAVNTVLDLWVTVWEQNGYDVSIRDRNAFLVHEKTAFDGEAVRPIAFALAELDGERTKAAQQQEESSSLSLRGHEEIDRVIVYKGRRPTELQDSNPHDRDGGRYISPWYSQRRSYTILGRNSPSNVVDSLDESDRESTRRFTAPLGRYYNGSVPYHRLRYFHGGRYISPWYSQRRSYTVLGRDSLNNVVDSLDESDRESTRRFTPPLGRYYNGSVPYHRFRYFHR